MIDVNVAPPAHTFNFDDPTTLFGVVELEHGRDDDVAASRSSRKPGDYTFFCAIPGHEPRA